MQDRHDRDLAESVMLDPAFQTSRGMEILHAKFGSFQTQTLLHLILGLQKAELLDILTSAGPAFNYPVGKRFVIVLVVLIVLVVF